MSKSPQTLHPQGISILSVTSTQDTYHTVLVLFSDTFSQRFFSFCFSHVLVQF